MAHTIIYIVEEIDTFGGGSDVVDATAYFKFTDAKKHKDFIRSSHSQYVTNNEVRIREVIVYDNFDEDRMQVYVD